MAKIIRLASYPKSGNTWLRVHLVRYEDLHLHPVTVFGAVVRFCGLDFDAGRVRKAVAFSDFSELQRQEDARGFRERPAVARGRFFRRGRPGSWRKELPPESARRIIETHGRTMRRFGYGDDSLEGGGTHHGD